MQKRFMENQYLNYYKNHSEKELLEVVQNPEAYNDEARLAAYDLLKEKNKTLTIEQITELESLKIKFNDSQIIAKKEEEQVEEKLQNWYSPTAILGFSIFLEPLFGAILLSQNLKKADKKKQATIVIIIGIVFLLGRMALVYTQRMTQVNSLIISIGAGLVFIEFFWKKHLGYKVKYNRKPIWKPLLIFLGVIILVFGLQMALNPELFQELLKQQQLQFAK